MAKEEALAWEEQAWDSGYQEAARQGWAEEGYSGEAVNKVFSQVDPRPGANNQSIQSVCGTRTRYFGVCDMDPHRDHQFVYLSTRETASRKQRKIG